MSWIEKIPFARATGGLRRIYTRIKTGEDYLDNIVQVHGLRPHTLEGHMALYKSVLHHGGNQLPLWLLECLGVLVSSLNRCEYCVAHHSEGLRKALRADAKTEALCAALASGEYMNVLTPAHAALADYAAKLTLTPAEVTETDVAGLREHGFKDGAILEVNQVVAYFAYANRTVLGLGVNTDGETLGLSPSRSDEPDDWQHR